MRSRFSKFVAVFCILSLLNLSLAESAFAITNAGYSGVGTRGRPSIAIVSGGASGIRVNTFNGNMILPRIDLTIPSRGVPLELKLTYNSNDDDVNGPFGFGWRFSYGMGYILQSDNDVVIIWGDGRTDLFDESAGTYRPVNEGVFASLVQYQPNKFRLTTKEQIQFSFDDPAHRRLTRIQDPNGNAITFTYNTSLQLTTITDAAGRRLLLTYMNGKVTTITDPNVIV